MPLSLDFLSCQDTASTVPPPSDISSQPHPRYRRGLRDQVERFDIRSSIDYLAEASILQSYFEPFAMLRGVVLSGVGAENVGRDLAIRLG
jgi:hypothetical protein